MSWRKKSSDEPSAETPQSTPAQSDDPTLEPLTAAEVDWVRSSIAELSEQDVRFGDIDDLGRHYDEMLNAWLRLDDAHRPDPNAIINQIGLAFGQYVADHAKLDWIVATDQHGTEIALHRARGNVLLYPTNVVAKRWAEHTRNTLPALARDMIATVEQLP
jgi:hypothetical protein